MALLSLVQRQGWKRGCTACTLPDFKPGAGRGKVELLHQHLPAVSALGVLLRKVETGIRGISHVIVDEIHERDINVSQS